MIPNTRPQTAAPNVPAKPAASRPGRVRPIILLWALGVPIPIILLILLVRGCMG